jgi:hypothetical protein
MARPRLSRRGRAERRLDPIRLRRPGWVTLFRLVAVAALLATAALITWSAPETCAPAPTLAASQPTLRAAAAPVDRAPGSSRAALPLDRDQAHPGTAVTGSGIDSVGRASPGNASEAAHTPVDGRAAVPAGTVGVPVRLAEPTALALVHPGDRVDLIRAGDDNHAPHAVAASALVLSVTGTDDPTVGGLLVAMTPAEAANAVAAPGRGFTVVIRP